MKPILFAHRGDPVHAPENTLESFRLALLKGAKAVEADARCTSDGVWVAFHDRSLKRMTGKPGWVSRTPWSALKKIPAVRIPRIGEVIALCRRGRARLFLDVKVRGREKELLRLIQRSGWSSRVAIGAGAGANLVRWRKALTREPLFWVTGHRAALTPGRVRLARRLKLAGLASYKGWVSKASLRRVHAAGLRLYVWTIRTPRELKHFSRLGADGIMSEVGPHV